MEYAINFAAMIVALYQQGENEWNFVRTTSLEDAIKIHNLESAYLPNKNPPAAFPIGIDPNKVPYYLEKFL